MNRSPMRAVCTPRYKYILNLHPEKKYETHITRGVARDGRDYWESWLAAAAHDPQAAQRVAAYEQRPREEFYDLEANPQETFRETDRVPENIKKNLRAQLRAWRSRQGDSG